MEILSENTIQVEYFTEDLKAENFRFVLAEFQLPNRIRINQSLLKEAEVLFSPTGISTGSEESEGDFISPRALSLSGKSTGILYDAKAVDLSNRAI